MGEPTMNKSPELQLQIVSRVGSLPMVLSTWQQLGSLYDYTKHSNTFVKFGLETAETALKIGTTIAAPVVRKLEKPVTQLDSFAVTQFDRLEQSVPIISKPADVIVHETYGATLKPSVDRLRAATQYSVDTYNNVKTAGIEKVTTVKQYTYDNVVTAVNTVNTRAHAVADYSKDQISGIKEYSNDKVKRALDTQYGKAVAVRVNSALDTADKYIDYYLPDQDPDHTGKAGGDAALHWKLSNRLLQRTYTQVDSVVQRSTQVLHKYSPVDLNKASGLFDQVRSLPARVKTTYLTVTDTIKSLPLTIRSSFARSKQMMNDYYKSFNMTTAVQKLRSTAWTSVQIATTLTQRYTYYFYNMVTSRMSGQKAITKDEPESIEMKRVGDQQGDEL